jgi:probable F420-dependent oxidoreductase
VKIRIGVALPPAGGAEGFASAVDRLEEQGVDSLWLSEIVFGRAVEPFVGMAYTLSRTSRLKVGTGVAILPGRHPVLVAKQLTSLAALAPKRVLPAFGLQPARPEERQLFPVPPGTRGEVFDESLHLLRRLLREETVTFNGKFHTVRDASVGPLPEEPLDVWLGGSGPVALRRVGRLGDGWLGSFIAPREAEAAREAIQDAAAEAGREIDPEHFGVSLAVAGEEISDDLVAAVRRRRPGVDPRTLIPVGWAATRRLIEAYTAAGVSKFVVRPAAVPPALDEFLTAFAQELMPMQTS